MFHFCAAKRNLSAACLASVVAIAFSGCDSPSTAEVAKSEPSPGVETAASQATLPADDADTSSVKTTAGDTLGEAAAASATKPLPTARAGAPTKALAAAGDRPYDKTFDDIKFEMEVGEPFERSMLTPEIEQMVGQRIRIRGFILPTAQKRGIKQFVLVRDNQECCFGPGAALYDCIFIEMGPGKSAEFSIRPVAVLGTFTVNEVIGPDGNHWAIYHIDAEEVRQ